MKFDGNLAWKQGTAMIRGNRDLLLPLGGVFFFLPSLALIMLIKQPQLAPGATPEAMMAQLRPFIASVLPFAALGSVLQSLGQLTMLELLGDGPRSTVGQALRKALGAFPTYFLTQMLTGFMMGAVLVLVASLGGVISPALGLMLGLYAVCQAYGRFLVAGPVIVAERLRNPFVALVRSVALTRGASFRIGNFLFLLAAAVFFAFMVVTIVFGIAAALTIGQGRTADIVTGFISSGVSAAAMAWFMAIIVAAYRQLAGAPASEAG